MRAMGQAQRPVGPVGDPASTGGWERLWRPFWALPAAIALGAVALGLLLPLLDERLGEHLPLLFAGGPGSARGLLSTIASAMISVTGLVFSITMVVLQLASSQFSPRLLGGFLSSRVTQVTLGVFTASFAYSLTVLRSVRSNGTQFVPQLSVSVAFLLVLASVALFLAFIHHITSSIQVSTLIEGLAGQTLDLVDDPPAPEDQRVASAAGAEAGMPEPGLPRGDVWWEPPDAAPVITLSSTVDRRVVECVELSRLVAAARALDVVVVLRVAVGEVRHHGQPLADVVGATSERDVERLRRLFGFARERTMVQDPLFGVRQLVDIAERALSPGVNDPTTATQVVDALHGILRRAGTVPDRSPYLLDEDGAVRVVDRPVTFAALLDLAVDEIAHYGRETPPVQRRMTAMLDDLEATARPEFHPALGAKRAALTPAAGAGTS